MKLRWQQALATNNKDDNQADENKEEEGGSEFYDNHKRTFDLTTVPATNVPFNKRATMPPYADEDTEAKIAFARKRLHSSIEDQCRKSKGAENLSDNAKKGLKQIKKRLKDNFILEGVDLLDHTSIFLLRTINHRVIPIICILS